jgi:hypothetical protein
MTTPTGQSDFTIDVLNETGVKVGQGPITSATSLSTREKLDSMGELNFSFPAADPRGGLVEAGRRYDVYDRGVWLGRYIHSEVKFSGSNTNNGSFAVKAYSVLSELGNVSVKFRRKYDNEPVSDIIDDLVSLVAGWAATVDGGLGNETITYEGESVLAAIEMLRARLGLHYRLDTSTPGQKIIEFGAFGANSGWRATKLEGQVQPEFNQTNGIAIIDRFSLAEDAKEIYNRVIPVGSGQGVSQLTIENATSGTYTVQSGLNQDGSSYFYIEDATSVAQYGAVERILNLSNIRPITNSDVDILNAKNALKVAGESFINRNLSPRVTYNVTLLTLGESVQVGDTIRVVYRGLVDGYKFVDLDADLNILGINKRRTSSRGTKAITITVSESDVRQSSDQALLINVVKDLSDTKIHVDPTLTYSPVGPYIKRIDPSNNAVFNVRIKSEVLLLNNAILRFTTGALKSSVTATATGGDHRHRMYTASGSTPTYSGVSDWQCKQDSAGAFTVRAQIPTDVTSGASDMYTEDSSGNLIINIVYGIFADTVFPGTVSIAINGIDRTGALGGPWGAVGASTGNIELDIATYLINAVGGLRQDHTITFSCTGGRGEIEFETDMLLTIQAIAV